MTRSVCRKRLKITGLVLSILMLGLWVFCALFTTFYVAPSDRWFISCFMGQITLGQSLPDTRSRILPNRKPRSKCSASFSYSQWKTNMERLSWSQLGYYYLGFCLPSMDDWGNPRIPGWLPIATVGLPTAVLWWRDRRPKGGFCMTCKYDLTENVSGTCPECGTAVE